MGLNMFANNPRRDSFAGKKRGARMDELGDLRRRENEDGEEGAEGHAKK